METIRLHIYDFAPARTNWLGEIRSRAITFVLVFLIFQIAINWPAYRADLRYAWLDRAASDSNLLSEITPPTLPTLGIGEIALPEIAPTPPDFRLVIPKIRQNVPVVETSTKFLLSGNWYALENEIQKDLRRGVVHYPGSAFPGERGNVVLTGHSSYYPWDAGEYKTVFALLPRVEIGEEFSVFERGREHRYRVFSTQTVKPSEVDVLRQTKKKIVTLITCVPIGTTLRRFVVQAEEI